jgi:hypothetical protein
VHLNLKAEAIDASGPQPINDQPGSHGMFMVGQHMLFLTHIPMFTMEKHMYQVILRASLSPNIMSQYQALRQQNPNKPYNLANVDSDLFTLPQLHKAPCGRTRRGDICAPADVPYER